MTTDRKFIPHESSDRDYPEDFSHENGRYLNICIRCKLTFEGHKRRFICKKCIQEADK